MTTERQGIDIDAVLGQMTAAELLQLRAMVDMSIAAAEMRERERELGLEPLEECAATGPDGSGSESKSGKGSGYVELKYINGCGPYAYKRARVGGRLTSTYIGKVKE
jgi:hypothetical protein